MYGSSVNINKNVYKLAKKKGKTKILHMLAFLLYEFVNYVGKISKEEVCSIFIFIFLVFFSSFVFSLISPLSFLPSSFF